MGYVEEENYKFQAPNSKPACPPCRLDFFINKPIKTGLKYSLNNPS